MRKCSSAAVGAQDLNDLPVVPELGISGSSAEAELTATCHAVQAAREVPEILVLSTHNARVVLPYRRPLTEYSRRDRIQASFALHAGRLHTQYYGLASKLPPDDQYEATLTVCLLQTLLANCTELLKSMCKTDKTLFREVVTALPPAWGLTSALPSRNTFPGRLTLERTLEHLRDALSHPTVSEGDLPATGYTSVPDGSGLVSTFRFTDSPWVSKGDVFWGALSKNAAKVEETAKAFERKHHVHRYLEVRPLRNGKFGIMHDGEPYQPVFVMDLPLPALATLVQCLADYLGRPAQWQSAEEPIHHPVASINWMDAIRPGWIPQTDDRPASATAKPERRPAPVRPAG